MGGAQKAKKSKSGKSPKSSPKKGDGPLPKSFGSSRVRAKTPPPATDGAAAATDSAAAEAAAPSTPLPRKLQTSGFLSYLNSAAKSSSTSVANMATSLQQRYKELDSGSKKQMVTDFFKAGGRKSGMEATFQQSTSTSQSSDLKGWAGYVTVGNLMEWAAVLSKNYNPLLLLAAHNKLSVNLIVSAFWFVVRK